MAGASEPSPAEDGPAGCPSVARMRAGLTDEEIIRLMERDAKQAESFGFDIGVYTVYVSGPTSAEYGDVDVSEFDWWFGDEANDKHLDAESGCVSGVAISARSSAAAWAELARRSRRFRQEIRAACRRDGERGRRLGGDWDMAFALELEAPMANHTRFLMVKTVAQISAEPLVKAVSRTRE